MQEKFFAFGAHGSAFAAVEGYAQEALLRAWLPNSTKPGVEFNLAATFAGSAFVVPRGSATSGTVDLTGKNADVTAFTATVTTSGTLGGATATSDSVFELGLSAVGWVSFPINASATYGADGYFAIDASNFSIKNQSQWARFERGRLWPNWTGPWYFSATNGVDFKRFPASGAEVVFTYTRPFLSGASPVIPSGIGIKTRCYQVRQIGLCEE